MHRTRRGFLTAGAGALTVSSAGCLGSLATADTPAGSNTQASFYLLYDLARNVTGDEMAVESIVPFGQHGHGWDGPTAGQQRDILTADLFVYMGDGFQPWADDVVETIHTDDADVAVVSARDGITLIDASSGHTEHEDGHDSHETEANGHDDHQGHDTGDDGHDDTRDHEHGEHDPHFWLDPRRTRHAVENIRDGMIAVDPDNEPAYRELTDEYVAELTALHDEFDATLSKATKDAVLVAGHNAFRYLGETYGFEIHALTDLSPDETVSAAARRRAQEIIEEHDIEYVLHPALEPRSSAEQLVADTDATDVLEITAISGVTDEWVDAGLGYVELMRTINLPALAKALGAE